MPHQKGANVELLLGFEPTFKTPATEGFTLPMNSFGLKGALALNKSATLGGSRNPMEPFSGNKSAAGAIAVPVDTIAYWYWLKAMFGAPVTTGTGPYIHEFKIGDSMPPVTLETAFEDLTSNRYQRFVGCKPSSWSMTVGGDGELVSDIEFVGANDTLETTSFDAAPDAVSFSRINNFEAAILEGGSTLGNATEVSFSVGFGLDSAQYVIGSQGVIGSLPEGQVEVSGTLKTLFEDVTLLEKAINNTTSSLKLTITGSASSILEIELQELKYERASIEVPGPQGLEVALNFQAFYTSGGEASAIVARLTNSEAHA